MPETELGDISRASKRDKGEHIVRHLVRRGGEFLRRKLSHPKTEGIPQRDFVHVPSAEFLEQQRYSLEKHKDEEKPLDTGPYAFGFVTRAYKELSNGNLTKRLESLLTLHIAKSQIKGYI